MTLAKRPETMESPTRKTAPASCGWGPTTAKVAEKARRSAPKV
jgi:hypothetical protein